MAEFTYENRLGNLPDIQRTWMWELLIPANQVTAEWSQDDLVVRCRTVSIPGRTIEPVEANFMGTKVWYPGKTTYESALTVNFDEYEDQVVHKAIHAWHEKIFNYDEGKQKLPSKKELAVDMSLMLYDAQGGNLERKILFVNAWPTAIAEAPMDYAGAEGVKYDVTFQYDHWRSVKV